MRTPMQNHLLAALPAAIYERLASHSELVALVRGSAIYEPGAELEYAYFPTSSIVSILSPMEDGASPEVAVIGNDGVVGIALLWAAAPPPTHGRWFKAPGMVIAYERASCRLPQKMRRRYGI